MNKKHGFMKMIAVLFIMAVFMLSSCGQGQKLVGGITLKKAFWAEDSLHTPCVELDFSQKGGYDSLEKDGTACEKVGIGAAFLGQRTDKNQEWEVVGGMTSYENEIKPESETKLFLYPPEGMNFTPEGDKDYCVSLRLKVTYPGGESLAPSKDSKNAGAYSSEVYIIEIKKY